MGTIISAPMTKPFRAGLTVLRRENLLGVGLGGETIREFPRQSS